MRSTISVGNTPNDGTGDTLRDAMVKINSNFQDAWRGYYSYLIPPSPNNTSLIGDINTNNYVYSPANSPVAISFTASSPVYTTIRVEFNCGQPQNGTGAGHMAIVRSYNNADDVMVGGWVVSPGDTNGYSYTFYDTIEGVQAGDTFVYKLANFTNGTIDISTTLGMSLILREFG